MVGLVRDDRHDRHGGHRVDLLHRGVRTLKGFIESPRKAARGLTLHHLTNTNLHAAILTVRH
jgi:hypothetical protein